MIDITELEKLARAATPGEWFVGDPNKLGALCGIYEPGEYVIADIQEDAEDLPQEANARYIAATNPQTVLKLIEVIRAQHEVIKAICKWDWEAMILPHHANLDKALLDIVRADNALAKAAELGVER